MPLLFFDHLFLLPDTIPKAAQLSSQRQIIPVAVDDQLRLVQAQLAALVQQPLVHIHGDALGQKQIMRTQRNDLRDLALQIYGAFLGTATVSSSV